MLFKSFTHMAKFIVSRPDYNLAFGILTNFFKTEVYKLKFKILNI